jgi:transmembrane sensor
MDTLPATREAIAVEATEWFFRLQSQAAGADERVAFSEWLIRSPLHIQEFLAVSSTWALIDISAAERFAADALIDAARSEADSARVVELHRSERRPATLVALKTSPNATRRWFAIAAGIVLVIGATLSYQALGPTTEFATSIGEQRSISLSDGSVVFLNTNSKVRLRWTKAERLVELLRGEARFQVAKNPARPFVVATPEATVRAIGTIFNVLADHKVTQVTVIEGRVKLRAQANEPRWSPSRYLPSGGSSSAGSDIPAQFSIELSAGERAAIDTHGRIDPSSGPAVERVDAWTVRRLVFRDETLDKVVAEFNRYHAVPMVVDDARLAALKINGVFDSNDPETLVAYLKSFETVQTRIAADGSIHLSIILTVTKPER